MRDDYALRRLNLGGGDGTSLRSPGLRPKQYNLKTRNMKIRPDGQARRRLHGGATGPARGGREPEGHQAPDGRYRLQGRRGGVDAVGAVRRPGVDAVLLAR